MLREKVQTNRKPAVVAAIAGVLWMVVGAYLAFWKVSEADAATGWIELPGNIAFGVLYATPGVLGLLAHRRRELYVPAAMCGFALALGTWEFVPVLIALSLAFLWAYERLGADRRKAGTAAVISLLFVALSYFVQQRHDDPYCWSAVHTASGIVYTVTRPWVEMQSVGPSGGSGGCGSDLVTPAEGLASLAIGLAIAPAAWLTGGKHRNNGIKSAPTDLK